MKLEEGQGLTTRDVARILGVSIATVKRYFDNGILTGWKNPITRRMVIDLESVKALKRKRKWKWRRAVSDAKKS
jgi:predicted site-specific integrase-resolvase